MRAVFLPVLLAIGCSQPNAAPAPDLRNMPVEDVAPKLLQDVCIANLGGRDGIARAARVGGWRSVSHSAISAWDGRGIPSTRRLTWIVQDANAVVYLETGISGGSSDTWYCRVAFTGGDVNVLSKSFENIEVGGVPLGEVGMRQQDVPNDGWTNLGYFRGVPEPWAVLNFSYKEGAPAHASLRTAELTARAR